MGFKTRPGLKQNPDNPGEYKIMGNLVYLSDRLGRTFIAKEGFSTDYASLPWFIQWLIPKHGRHDNPAIIHDAAYRGKLHVITDCGHNVLVKGLLSRKVADKMFFEGMIDEGVSIFRAWLMYRGVRLGGSSSFKG